MRGLLGFLVGALGGGLAGLLLSWVLGQAGLYLSGCPGCDLILYPIVYFSIGAFISGPADGIFVSLERKR